MKNDIQYALSTLKKNKPLILNLTNFVTMEFMANSLLAIGAAPIMTCSEKELDELIKMSSAININIGTLTDDFINLAKQAVSLANYYEKPIIFDPVGAGASKIRTQTARELMYHATIIRGNASEVLALLDDDVKSHGVESTLNTKHIKESAIKCSSMIDTTLVISGKVDLIIKGNHHYENHYGDDLMTSITGMGCTLSAVIAAFSAVISEPFEAAKLATCYYSYCGMFAKLSAKTPGRYKSTFIDALYQAESNEKEALCAINV